MIDGHEEHDDEGDHVAQVGDGEAEVRGDEEEIEGDDAEHRRDQGGHVAEAHRDEDDPEQIDHDDVGELLVPEAVPADRRADGDDGDRRGGTREGERPRRLLARGRGRGRLRAGLPGDDVHVDLQALADDVVEERRAKDARASADAWACRRRSWSRCACARSARSRSRRPRRAARPPLPRATRPGACSDRGARGPPSRVVARPASPRTRPRARRGGSWPCAAPRAPAARSAGSARRTRGRARPCARTPRCRGRPCSPASWRRRARRCGAARARAAR